jgi:hypothetical protein
VERTCPKCGSVARIAGLVVPRPPLYGGAAPTKSFACTSPGCDGRIVVGPEPEQAPGLARQESRVQE